MYEVISDDSGGIHFFPQDDYRNAGPPRRRPRRRPRPHAQPYPAPQPAPYHPQPHYAPTPYPQPYPGHGMPPMPYGYPAGYPQHGAGLDMRAGLKAIGEFLPGIGQLFSAFRRAPERPTLTGQPDKDMASLADYIGESFDRDRTGAQASGVLATTGAMLKILAEL